MPSPSPALAAPTVRVLPPEEWARLSAYEPFRSGGLPDPTHWRVLVAEVGPDLVGFVCLFDAVHLEPLWIAPEYRLRPRLFEQLLTDLWSGARAILRDAEVQAVFAVVDDDHRPRGARFVEHLGFRPAQAQLFVVPVSDLRLGGG
ncbi:MAG TPA: hypothetical protein VIX41_03355 [Acidimicrobiales bacterium]